MNRQSRRHPTHPYLPILYPSKKRVLDEKVKIVKAPSRRKRFLRRRYKKKLEI